MKVIAISNQKGGVAKTTTCLSLGAALAEMGHSVLLIDLDPQANLSVSLGLKPANLRLTVVDTLLGNQPLVGVSRESDIFALDVVPASHELNLIDKVLYKRPGYEQRLRQTLERMDPDLYQYVLLDCPPALGPLTMNALMASDLLIIPVQCELYAVHSLRRTIQLLPEVHKSNPDLTYRVLVTMYDQRNKISRIMLKQLQDGLGAALFDTLIQIDTKLRESPAFGQPVTAYAPTTRGAQQYRALAEELTNTRQSTPVAKSQPASVEENDGR